MKKKKRDYVNEILRFCRSLTQYKYDADEDKMFKKLIAENLAEISRIENEEREKREERKAENEIKKHQSCF